MPRVLIVTEDLRAATSLTAELAGANYTVAATTLDLEDFHEALGKGTPDAIILDARLPSIDITSTRKTLHQNDDLKGAALIALVSEESLSGVTPLNVEEFVIYSTRSNELLLRLRILLAKLQKLESGNIVRIKGLVIDLDNYSVEVDGQSLELTFKEFELLKFLITHRGRVFTREALLNRVWGYDYFGGARTVDVHVRRLRAKLGEYDSNIETVRNVGYRFSG